MAKGEILMNLKNQQLHKLSEEGKMEREEIYSNTIFDDVLKTMQERAEMLFIPAINEFFHKSFAQDEKIIHLKNEHQKLEGKIITDTCLLIRGIRYHIECQSNIDGTMVIRMFEYDFMIALEHSKKTEDGYSIEFPHSCVIYLRHNSCTKDELYVTVNLPNRTQFKYKVPIIKVQEYSKEDIFEKKLYLLLPYYLMRYENELDEIEEEQEKRQQLIGEYNAICNQLKEELVQQYPDIYRKLLELMKKIADYILRDKKETKKGMGDLMDGKVLELETDKILEQGEARGEVRGVRKMVLNMLSNGVPSEEISRMCNLPLEEVLEIQSDK